MNMHLSGKSKNIEHTTSTSMMAATRMGKRESRHDPKLPKILDLKSSRLTCNAGAGTPVVSVDSTLRTRSQSAIMVVAISVKGVGETVHLQSRQRQTHSPG